MGKRILISFDDKTLAMLESLVEESGVSSLAEGVRMSVSIVRTLQQLEANGHAEVLARNTETGKEALLVIPSMLKE